MIHRSRPPSVYFHRPEGSYLFKLDDPANPEAGYVFIGLKRKDAEDYTLFCALTDAEKDWGWMAFDEFIGRYRR